jgi:phenylpropionate dioxygenase-like ring-hydroxylating dioxygenase large terminal subunit
MLTRTPPMLSDGTAIEDLVNIETREVRLRVLADVELYDLEMERIFGKTWIMLGFASEIPNAGDFMVRQLGADQVIVNRGRDDQINVVLNVCPHRGMRVCTSEAGNTAVHKCIYHGWAFRPNGDFIGAPMEAEQMHGTIMPKEELGLRKARVKVYGGLIFATWNIEGPSFDDFLGDMKWYFDMLFCRTDGGMEVLGPPQRFTIRANWKTAGEQSAADGFHTLSLHRWLGEFAKFGDGDLTTSMYGIDVGSLKGHALRCMPVAQKFKQAKGFRETGMTLEEKLEVLCPPGVTKDMLPQLKKNLSPEQLQVLVDQPPQVGGVFPNMMIAFVYIPQADGSVLGLTSIHTYVPKGPHELEFMNWILSERDAPEAYKQLALENSVRQFGTSGMIEQDDSDTWPHMTQMAKGPMGRQGTMKYQAVCTEPPPANWPGPGLLYSGFTKDDTQWNWWLRWRELMTATI